VGHISATGTRSGNRRFAKNPESAIDSIILTNHHEKGLFCLHTSLDGQARRTRLVSSRAAIGNYKFATPSRTEHQRLVRGTRKLLPRKDVENSHEWWLRSRSERLPVSSSTKSDRQRPQPKRLERGPRPCRLRHRPCGSPRRASTSVRMRGSSLVISSQSIASHYIRNLREEVRKGIRGRLKQGLYPFKAFIGYLDQGGGKPKIADPERASLNPPVHSSCTQRQSSRCIPSLQNFMRKA